MDYPELASNPIGSSFFNYVYYTRKNFDCERRFGVWFWSDDEFKHEVNFSFDSFDWGWNVFLMNP